jgi:hypothetical protein
MLHFVTQHTVFFGFCKNHARKNQNWIRINQKRINFMDEFINILDSKSNEFIRAYEIFHSCSDEKEQSCRWVQKQAKQLPLRRIFIDAGAGDGERTGTVNDLFEQTIAIEPNSFFRSKLKKKYPDIQILPDMITDAPTSLASSADMVQCIHVFYHINPDEWMLNVEKMMSWLSDSGVLLLGLAHHESESAKLCEHFYNVQFNLEKLGESVLRKHGDRYEVITERVPGMFRTYDYNSVYRVIEWFLNDFHGKNVPYKRDVEEYIRKHIPDKDSGFCFSCDQSFLQIRQRINARMS